MNREQKFEWAVVGAGPAGIAAVGKLIDYGVLPQQILWIDKTFTVGDFGTKWQKVPSNTTVNLFQKFFMACKVFEFNHCPPSFAFHQLSKEETCQLSFVAEPLQWITRQIQAQVRWRQGIVKEIKLNDQCWCLCLEDITVYAKNVVLAVGAEPKILSHEGITAIPLEVALNPPLLAKVCDATDTVAIFGSSHSAILIIRNLLEQTSVKKILNFYQQPLRYAIDLGEEILFDDTGLKGTTAKWARENLHGNLPEKLQRILSSSSEFKQNLEKCSKAIYAIGFEKRFIKIDGIDSLIYNDKSGIIAPGLFGVGIAFPEAMQNRLGIIEHRVGLWKFMEYLNRVIPLWLKYPL